MPRIVCILCERRTDAQKQRVRVGTESNWAMLKIHAEKNDLNMASFSRDDCVCLKCHSLISHYRMKDRGPNRVMKNSRPIVYEPGIQKRCLRGYSEPEPEPESNGNTDEDRESTNASDVNESNVTANERALSTVQRNNNLQTNEDAVNNGATSLQCHHTVSNGAAVLDETASSSNANEQPAVLRELTLPVVQSTDLLTDEVSATVVATFDQPSIESTDAIAAPIATAGVNIEANEVDSYSPVTDNPLNEELIVQTSSSATVSHVFHLQGLKSTQSRCCVCQSKNGRKALPWAAIQQAWFDMRCYISKTNRTCEEHLSSCDKFTDDSLKAVGALKQSINVKIAEFEPWLHGISNLPKPAPYNFDEDGIEAEKYKMLLGIDKESFDDLLQYLKGMRNTSTRSLRNALAMFLLLLRNNMKQEVIAHNFSTTQQVVSKTIDAVATALHENFVPKYLGYHHMTREEALEKHSIQLTSKVLGQPEHRLCLIVDGTYNYIEKPADFELQRKTFSAHKKRNLIKPMYLVLPTGYILEAAGPYFCDAKNNDAANIRHHYKHSDLLLFLEDDDYFLLDRGYRDVVAETENNRVTVFMPSLLTGKRTHFTCEEANYSRMVTMFRWVVEAVNGRVKNIFPFFKHTIEGTYAPKIMMFNRIACAIINAYFPLLYKNNEFHDVISQVCSSEIPKTNKLKDEIEELGLKRMTTRWERASACSVTDFPRLSMDDLKRITLGTYQIKIAERYIENHLKNDSSFGIYIHRENDCIIRARLQSRFSKSQSHDAWVKFEFEEEKSGYEAIIGLYCTCKVGERTLGCCSHLAAIIRYLGFDRHQPSKTKTRSRFTWDAIDCAEFSDDSDNASDNDV